MAIYSGKESIFRYFEEITQIPRHSGDEKAIVEYIVKCNEKRGHELSIDEYGNVLIYVPATEGYENEATIILQSHLDMYYEQDDDSDRDLTKEGLDLTLSGVRLYAEGSSLGATSAFGIAAMLMIMNDEELDHPKLELLFTSRRHEDMEGARKFDASSLLGVSRILISLCGADSSIFLIGNNPDKKCMHHDWTYGFDIPVCLKALMYQNMMHSATTIRPSHDESEIDILKESIEKIAGEFGESIRFDAMIMGPDIAEADTPGESILISSMQETYNLLKQLLLTKDCAYKDLLEYDEDSIKQFEPYEEEPVRDPGRADEITAAIDAMLNDTDSATDDYATDDYDIDENEEKLGNLLNRINSLVGVSDFKKLCNRIAGVSKGENKVLLKRYLENCAVCISIRDGDGYTTLIELFNELLQLCCMIASRYDEVPEIKKNISYEGIFRWIEANSSADEPLSIDLTFKMRDTETDEFVNFLRRLYSERNKSLTFFKIPYSEGMEKERMIRALSSVFQLVMIDAPPFSSAEYLEHATHIFGDFGFVLDPDAHEPVERFIIEKRNKAHFYGLLSIAELVKDIIYQKSVNEAKRKENMSFLIRKEDLVSMEKKYCVEQGSVETLDDMIGVDELRERIDEILVQLELSREMPYEKRPGMHMLFTGGPGTGKTTVARILGRILKEKGLLSNGQFYERTGRELVGRYIGETAPLTNAICRDAYGSILFIDEAYTLYRGDDDDRDFGREALDALVTQMENHRQDFIVILAGYSDQIKRMLEANPGLRSRIPYEVKFRNFTRDELAEIYMKMVEGSYEYSGDLEEAVKNYFAAFKDEVLEEESFSNARFVRNLFERSVSKAALRIQAQTGERIRGDMIRIMAKDFETAIETEEFKSLLEKKHITLGFA
ncbi:MAG: AAA family ATPase [Lachnospiraceae bacterium]|nr:AAA family ATPase [Lachnospiraceae bacterium]